jgi:hypothetical protein
MCNALRANDASACHSTSASKNGSVTVCGVFVLGYPAQVAASTIVNTSARQFASGFKRCRRMRRALEVSIDLPSPLYCRLFVTPVKRPVPPIRKAEAARAAEREYTLSRKDGQAIGQEIPGGR